MPGSVRTRVGSRPVVLRRILNLARHGRGENRARAACSTQPGSAIGDYGRTDRRVVIRPGSVGRRMELEALLGEQVRRAERTDVPAPVSATLYAILLAQASQIHQQVDGAAPTR